MNLVKIISTEYDDAKKRISKFFRLGTSDVQTAIEAGPYGTDASPIKNMVAVYSPTLQKGEAVIVGYLNKNQLAAPGEHRIYSTNETGVLKTYVWLKGNGDTLLGGDAYHLARFEQLQTAYNELQGKVNDHITAYNAHVHSGVTTGLGSSGPTISTANPSTADISLAKADKLKTG